jgi:long-chain acyl-CoA synthetase
MSPTPGPHLTLPQLLLSRVTEAPDADAVLRKRLGIWHRTSWSDLAGRVSSVAHGLHEAGVRAGDVVAVLSDNRPEWLVLELAAQSLQAQVVGQHPESSGAEITAVLRVTGARAVVVEDAQQLQAVRSAMADLPDLVLALCLEARAAHGTAPGGLVVHVLPDLEQAGRAAAGAAPGWWRERVAEGRSDDVALLCPLTDSSATLEELSPPRITALSHRNLVAASASLTDGGSVTQKTRYVSVLPLAWSWEQVAGLTTSLRTGFALNFPESPSTQQSDLRDIGPDVLLAPARLWESTAAELLAAVEDAGRVRRATWDWALRLGSRRASGGGSSPAWRVADALVLRAARDRLGMTRLRHAYSFGAALRPDVADLFRSIDVDLRQLYGSTDAGSPVAVEPDRRGREAAAAAPPAGVGPALPGVELRIADDGEVLVRSDAVPAAPARSARDAHGWLHTGDLGHLNGDVLVLHGRQDDLLHVDGRTVDPRALEAALRVGRYVEEAVVVALDPPGALGALVVVDPVTTGAWVEEQRLHATSYAALTALPEVGELVAAEVGRVLRDQPGGDAVQRCVLVPRRLDVQRGEVTRSRVVRRHVVCAHLSDELTALSQPAADTAAATVVDVPGRPVPAVEGARA